MGRIGSARTVSRCDLKRGGLRFALMNDERQKSRVADRGWPLIVCLSVGLISLCV